MVIQDESISTYILRLRLDKGVTQYRAAKELNISRAALKRLEDGIYIPCRHTLEAMSEYYKAPLSELLARTKLSIAIRRERRKAELSE